MKLGRLATCLMAAAVLAGCECGDEEELVTSEECSDASPGTQADFENNATNCVYFGFDRQDLVPEARKALEEQAAWLCKNPNVCVEVNGYCDARGTCEYNDKLGQRRCDSAKDYLVNCGVGCERITTVSYGNRVTLVPGTTEEDYAKNRTAITMVKS